ncbi:MAG TPA: class I SAM-dependent methyltransferase [Ktedonobacteraceae bacterium]|nr:class I SAM-dependent methyltransferase [Ktedonobacteraceae bacterium]
MRTYYAGEHTLSYNRRWQAFLEKTLAAALSVLNATQLQEDARVRGHGQPLRILDAACGTGLLLKQLAHLLPEAELYGVDASHDMLMQAQSLLQTCPHVHLLQASLSGEERAGLPYAPAFFDLIICTNSVHYFKEPEDILRELHSLLAPMGQMVIEDYVLRGFPFPWKAFEWAIRWYDPQHIRLYTLSQAQALCRSLGFQVVSAKSFPIDIFCQGWVVCCH